MRMRLLLLSLFLVTCFQSQAQEQRKKHYVISPDTAKQIQIDIVDPTTIEYWAGDQIMITSQVKVYGINGRILDHFFDDQKRYEIIDTLLQTDLFISNLYSNRSPLKIKGRTCYEEISVKILMPAEFVKQGDNDNLWVLKEEEVEEVEEEKGEKSESEEKGEEGEEEKEEEKGEGEEN